MKAADARVLLTGATGGIGHAVAAELLDRGAAVLLSGRSPGRLAALARELGRTPAQRALVHWHPADLDDPAALAGLRDAAVAWQANVLVNNAGVASFGRLEQLDPAHLERVLCTNLLAPMRLTQALLPWLRSRPQAQVIQIGSVLGRLGLPGYSVYSASKFGLRGFSEALRRELRGSPVRVQYLGPRSTRTAFNDRRVEAYNSATGTAMDDPRRVAVALADLLESGAAERFLGFPESVAARLGGLVPTLLDGAFDKHRASLPTTLENPS
ncbi:MAG: SDR family oxidoreductase [Piscinibacter sp.]|nr:SDR family oxidoreductase [Piscinibacter sp.]